MKLNAWNRTKIVEAALHAAFLDRLKSLAYRENELALKVRIDALGKKTCDLLAGLPDGIAMNCRNLSVQFATDYTELKLSEGTRMPASMMFGDGRSTTIKVYDACDPLSEEYASIRNDKTDVRKEQAELKASLIALLASYGTVEKLLLAWPDGKPFIPEFVEPIRTLPAVLVGAVNEMMTKARAA